MQSIGVVAAAFIVAASWVAPTGAAGGEMRAEVKDNCLILEDTEGPGRGKHIVLVSGDEEYRSEESIPQLAKILARHHGFKCTVLFAIDRKDGTINPVQTDNIPGLEVLADADLMVIFTRFRDLPDEQMKHIVAYVDSGRPIVGLRTATHAFKLDKHKTYEKYDWRSREWPGGFGRQVLGETWINHYGKHQKESTRGIPAEGMEDHPILRGVKDIWGPSDVYGITELSGVAKPVVMGQVLTGMKPTDEPKPDTRPMPVAWIKTYKGKAERPARVFTTTMGHAGDFKNEGFRRMVVNACYWALGMEEQISPDRSVALVGDYDPVPIGFGKNKKGVRVEDHLPGRSPASAPGKTQ
jgi:type 1 glutamine amidotransferase